MIQASELRIGNWVNGTTDFVKFPMPLKVTGLGAYSYYGHNGELNRDEFGIECGIDGQYYNFSDFSPIPLSPEILEKAGFELRVEDGIEKDYKNYPIYVKFQHNGGLLITIAEYLSCSHIQYVHQLQNLFYCMTQTELTINF